MFSMLLINIKLGPQLISGVGLDVSSVEYCKPTFDRE